MAALGPLLPRGEIDEKRMAYVLDEEYEDAPREIPFEWEVCGTCRGKGQHVNPSIDAHGITAEEWDQWSYEEQEEYRNGYYDVPCYECKGRRVSPALAPRNPSHIRWLQTWTAEAYDERRERERELRFGY